MRIVAILTIVSISLISLTGCSKNKVACSRQEGVVLVGQIISEAAEKSLTEQKGTEGNPVFDAATVRATLGQIAITMENIRTSKEDPNSTKVFCEGSINITIPTDLLKRAEEGRELAKLGTLAALAVNNSLQQSTNSFRKSIEYNVQPTDDGKQIFAELMAVKPMAYFLSEIVGSAIIKPIIEESRIQQAKSEEAERLQVEAKRKSEQAEQSEAELSQAKQENALANQAIDELWKNIPEDERNLMLDTQKLWIKKKDLDCKVDSTTKSTDPSKRELYRLNCDTAAIAAKVTQIKQGLK